jgi:hypothetical protein
MTASKDMAKNYLKGQFCLDLLSTVPFDTFAAFLLGEAGYFKLLGALKLVRVLRLNRIITYLRTTEENKATLKLLNLVFFLIMYVHCFGCTWWMIVASERIWVPPPDWGNQPEWFFIYDKEFTYKYFTVVHSAMLNMTGNDIGPRNSLQIIFVTLGMFAGAMINANLFGELAI